MSSTDTDDMVVLGTVEWAQFTLQPLVDGNIDFLAPPLVVRDINEAESISEFRFRKGHIQELADKLWPKLGLLLEGTHEAIQVKNNYVLPYETGLLLVLYRFARPRRLRPDMEKFFKMRKSKISAAIATFTEALYELALPYMSDPSIFRHRFRLYADLIFTKSGGAVQNVWGFIDGTLRKTCRPGRFQRLAYSGHKRCHGIKFQSVVTPDGLIAHLYGPIPGSRHDSYMLGKSGLIAQLRALMPPGTELFSLYGDPAYPQSGVLFGGFRNPPAGSLQAAWNTRMSKVREVVEWLFKEIVVQWSYLDFRASMKIFQSPIGRYFVIAAFLTNLRSCCYGSQTSNYFSCDEDSGKLSMAEYIDLI